MNSFEKKYNFVYLAILFVAGGALSGVAALALSALLPLSFSESRTSASIAVLVIIEEAAKFLIIYGLLKSYSLFKFFKLHHYLIYSVAAGFGFGLFELLIITLGASLTEVGMLRPMIVHITTAFVFGIGFYLVYKTRSLTTLAACFLLSVAGHLWYNVVVIKELF